ncbi:MBL fold metallo-hydrolase [Sciscionella sediminilitoris]|uniref:MBL fold metallo-hydrolase n=1 Tax=Sciscionella sediminilitoris TaxID=1445613 RepID=UPI00056D48B2|nr:MBL fold metallo-hydrolase [Sciscionella sp. SE31]
MQLTVLGCSGSFAGPGAPASGYLVEAEGYRLVMDLGNGTLSVLSALLDPFAIDALLLSHLHPDHCADFTSLIVHRRFHPEPPYDPRQHKLDVYAPAEAPSRLAAAHAPSSAELAETDLGDVFAFHPLSAQTLHLGPFEVTVFPVLHVCEAFGFRIRHGDTVLAYTGDTAMTPALEDLAADADALLCEASWTHGPDRPPALHLSGREAGELAARTGAKRLLLTHIPPWTDPAAVIAEAKESYGARPTVVSSGSRYAI